MYVDTYHTEAYFHIKKENAQQTFCGITTRKIPEYAKTVYWITDIYTRLNYDKKYNRPSINLCDACTLGSKLLIILIEQGDTAKELDIMFEESGAFKL